MMADTKLQLAKRKVAATMLALEAEAQKRGLEAKSEGNIRDNLRIAGVRVVLHIAGDVTPAWAHYSGRITASVQGTDLTLYGSVMPAKTFPDTKTGVNIGKVLDRVQEVVAKREELAQAKAVAAAAKTEDSRLAQVLPQILAYLEAHPAHSVQLSHCPDGSEGTYMVLLSADETILGCADLGDDPGAVVLAALANWTQANQGGAMMDAPTPKKTITIGALLRKWGSITVDCNEETHGMFFASVPGLGSRAADTPEDAMQDMAQECVGREPALLDIPRSAKWREAHDGD